MHSLPVPFITCCAHAAASLPLTLQTLQRGLPRPLSIDKLPPPKAPVELEAMSLRERAEAELNNELAALVQHDNEAYPLSSSAADGGAAGGGSSSSKKRKKGKAAAEEASAGPAQVPRGPPLVQYSLAELAAARELLQAEAGVVKAAMGHGECEAEEYFEAWVNLADDFVVDEQVCWGSR